MSGAHIWTADKDTVIFTFLKKTAHQIWAQCSNSKWSESVWLGQNEHPQISFLFGWSAYSHSTPTVWYDIVDLELWAHIWWFSSTHQYCRSAKYEPATTTLSGSTNIVYVWSWDSGTYLSKIIVFWTHGKICETRFEEVILVKKYFNQNICSSRTRNSLEKWSYEFSHQNLIFPTRLKKNLGPTVWILLHLRVNGFLSANGEVAADRVSTDDLCSYQFVWYRSVASFVALALWSWISCFVFWVISLRR